MRYIPGVYQGVPNQREFRAAAIGRPLQWERSDRPAALAAYLNVEFLADCRVIEKISMAKNEARTERGCFVFCRLALNTTWRSPRTTRRSIRCPTAGQPTPTSDSGNLTCRTGIAPFAGA